MSKCCRYVIDLTVLHSLSLGELGVGVQCFGEFGASGCARMMKILRRIRVNSEKLEKNEVFWLTNCGSDLNEI